MGLRLSGILISGRSIVFLTLLSFLGFVPTHSAHAEAASAINAKDCRVRYKDVTPAKLFPPTCVGPYVIGTPYDKTDPHAESGFTDPDGPNPRRGFYDVSCAAARTGEIEVFLRWNGGPVGAEKRFVKNTYSLGVLYFLDDGKRQFIYGTIATDRAKSDGLPIITDNRNWVCELHKS